MDNVFKLHVWPLKIVSDRDSIFTSKFWNELLRISGSEVLLSSAYHPKMDAQIEAMNKILECYLRCFSSDRPKDWMRWLPLAGYSYNTSTKISRPYEAVYGHSPPCLLPYELGTTRIQVIDEELQTRDFIATLVKETCKRHGLR